MSTPIQAMAELEIIVESITDSIKLEMASRGTRAANELRNETMKVLKGGRSGKSYYKLGSRVKYTASAPGEAPANRTGNLRESFNKTRTYADVIGNSMEVHAINESALRTEKGYLLGDLLDEGTPGGKIAPRPFKQKAIDSAMPAIQRIFSQPYV